MRKGCGCGWTSDLFFCVQGLKLWLDCARILSDHFKTSVLLTKLSNLLKLYVGRL
jgi:hypothetical protein